MSYIVKNCPSCRYTPKRYIDGIDYICWNAQNFNSSVRGLCQDCTDCVIKQAIENCKNKIHIYECYDTDYALGKVNCAKSILQLFDIEEVK